MSLERKGETQLWRTTEETGLVAALGAGFIVIVGVGDAARDGKVVHSEVAASA